MGLLISFVFALLSFIFMYLSTWMNKEEVKQEKEIVANEIKAKMTSPSGSLSIQEKYNAEDIEHLLIRGCQMKQALVIRCQQCYLATPDMLSPGGKASCDLPTDSFCREAKNLDPYNISSMWSWLPNPAGPISDLSTATKKDPTTLSALSELDAGVRYNVVNAMDSALLKSSKYRYVRPTGGRIGDPCSLEGIVVRKN